MRRNKLVKVVPLVAAAGLVLAACGSGGGSTAVAEQPAAAAAAPAEAAPAAPAAAAAPAADTAAAPAAAPAAAAVAAPAAPVAASKSDAVKAAPKAKAATAKAAVAPAAAGSGIVQSANGAAVDAKVASTESAAQQAANQKIYDQKHGATDTGISKSQITLGSVSMHGMPLGNVLVDPQVRANMAAVAQLNDRGGILGRRIAVVDCDDGPGEVSRAKACIKKLVGQDNVFALITGIDWATASIHDDLQANHLPYVGAWAYSQTEWQDPFMFPTHTSMLHEARMGAHWVADVIHPKTYGLVCLTSPEMQISCNIVKEVLDATGAKMVKKVDVSISETSMSAQVLAMRAANPDHIIHYVINPATMSKFFIESAQQGYWPPKGISGNHMATEIIGSIFGQWPAGRYWTNTTYRLWGPEYMATMQKYARGNRGTNNHIAQAGYVAVNIFAQAAKMVGPNLTRDRLMAQLGNGTVWASDSTLDQKFMYAPSERLGPTAGSQGKFTNPKYAQAREFMYKYTSPNTVSDPSGSPSGMVPDKDEFVLHTH